jgi:hypothetical protein
MNAPEQFHTINARHVDIAQQYVNVAFLQTPQRSLSVGRSLHSIT